MNNLPANLKRYLEGSGKFGHLKIMATLSAVDSESAEWGVFFGNKGPKPQGDSDFQGTMDGNNSQKPTWVGERPLWLVPLTLQAKDEAMSALNAKRRPQINCAAIVVRNPGKEKGDNWKNYKFLYEDQPAWRTDPVLELPLGTEVEGLNGCGTWARLHATGDGEAEAWPVWFTNLPYTKSAAMIKIPAPRCHIMNREGAVPPFDLWFGVRVVHGEWNYPFLAIDPPPATPWELRGVECPIVWYADRRKDDVVRPRRDAVLNPSGWTRENPLENYGSKPGATVKEIMDVFGSSKPTNPYAWLIREGPDEPPGRTILSVLFVHNYRTEGQLEALIGRTVIPRRNNNISILQVCRRKEFQLLTKVTHLTCVDGSTVDNIFVRLWNQTTGAVASGLLTTAAAAPTGVVPWFSNEKRGDYGYVSEWSGEYPSCVLDAQNTYTLKASFIEKAGAPASFKSAEVGLPLLRHQHYRLPDNREKVLQLVNTSFGASKEGFQAVDDNGTLFQLFLDDFAVGLKDGKKDEAIVLRDGAMAFTINRKKPPLKESELPLSRYGRFRLLLQLARAQRPFFLWQWYPGIDLVDTIVASYAVEDFCLPVKSVQAAGQDPLAKDKFLAPRSIGSAGEGFGERTDPPLVIPLNPETPDHDFFLTFSEGVNVGQNHRLDIRLQEINPQAARNTETPIKAVLLDAQPQFVGLIHARFLQSPGYDDGAWVLARRSPVSEEGGGWEILDDRADTEGFHLVLPAQVIGDSICSGESVQLWALGAPSYTWTPSNGLSSTTAANPMAAPRTTTQYRVVGQDAQQCFSDTAYVTIAVGAPPVIDLGPDVSLPVGTTHSLQSTVQNGPIVKWVWSPSTDLSCSNCPLPVASIKKDISYSVTATNAYGCTATGRLSIKVLCDQSQIFIPNAFSPDGDGANDVLMVRTGGSISIKAFKIFNRWGELVFERSNFPSNDPAHGWDGKVRGVVGPPDVYVYTAEVLCPGGATFFYKGNVSIIK